MKLTLDGYYYLGQLLKTLKNQKSPARNAHHFNEDDGGFNQITYYLIYWTDIASMKNEKIVDIDMYWHTLEFEDFIL